MSAGIRSGSCEPRIIKTNSELDAYLAPQKRAHYNPNTDETILIVVRHGQNESNAARLFGGRTLDGSLTALGIEQSQAAGKELKNRIAGIDRVVTAKMCRTTETAQQILSIFPSSQPEYEVASDDALEERWVGKYEGQDLDLYAEANRLDKEASENPEISFEDKMNYSPDRGNIETYREVFDRFSGHLQGTCKEMKGRVVLAVVDSGVFRSFLWHLGAKLGFYVTYAGSKPENGSFGIISVKDGEMSLLDLHKVKLG